MGGWVLAVAVIVGAPALKEKPPDPPAGEWDLELMVRGGPPVMPKGRDDFLRLRFTPTSRAAVSSSFPRPSTARATFAQAGGVLHLDIYQGGPDTVERGIWKVEGHTLTICQGLPGEPRPTDFTCPRGSKRVLMVLRRIKAE
ncbi:MAG TPA: hypothetical protein VKD90_05030 [Gemmataceae bacterium]|nr:hypothetical protein [Gemmataceae bacterium]